MSTEWVVTTAAERIALDGQKKGETTFTVTNPSRRADRAVFDVVPGDGADRSWFAVEDPQRLIRSSASAAYLVKVVLPAGAPAGSYAVQARVYSADSAPEESSVLSGRVLFEVAPEPAPQRRRFPLWMLVVAALLVLVLGVVGWLVLRGGPEQVAMPALSQQTEAQAVTVLRAAGLQVGTVTHRHDPGQGGARVDAVTAQSVPAGTQVAPGSTVELTVNVTLSAPKPLAPAATTRTPANVAMPELRWEQPETYVTGWRVTVLQQECVTTILNGPLLGCTLTIVDTQVVRTPSAVPQVAFIFRSTPFPSRFHTGLVVWQVAALDDAGRPGPAAESRFTVEPGR